MMFLLARQQTQCLHDVRALRVAASPCATPSSEVWKQVGSSVKEVGSSHANSQVWHHKDEDACVASHRPHGTLGDGVGSSSSSSMVESIRRGTTSSTRVHAKAHVRDRGGTALLHGALSNNRAEGVRDRRWPCGLGFDLERLKPSVRIVPENMCKYHTCLPHNVLGYVFDHVFITRICS
jgi:hypothetical protein